MEIRIVLDGRDPPSGSVWVDEAASDAPDRTPVAPFAGWLGLLHVINEIVNSPEDKGAPES